MRATPEAWTAVVNPAAGRRRARQRLPVLVDALAHRELDVEVRVSRDPDDMVAIAQAAFAAGRGVVACGGDGTVSALAGVAAAADGVLGILPVGSGNDFARQLDIPRDDIRAAVAVLATGQVRRVDLGHARTADGTERWFTTVANAGFDAEANRWANGVTWTTGTPLYVLAVLRTLVRYRPRPFRITIDDETVDIDAWLVAVGNTRTYAGGMMITPRADVHDGLLDVCVVGPVRRAGFLRTFPKVFRGTHVQHPMVSTWRARRVAVESRDPGAARELWGSGERIGLLPATITPAADALAVMVP
jgi:diacylglycerol kinase (ATP)